MTSKSVIRLATAAGLGFLAVTGAQAQTPPAGVAPAKGDLWEVTSQMSMEGMDMAMPAQKVKVCSPKEWTSPPAPAERRQRCENSDFRRDGAKATWKVTCAGPPAMTGEGEITRDGDSAFAGTIKFNSEAGAMTIRLNGVRVAECDNPQQ